MLYAGYLFLITTLMLIGCGGGGGGSDTDSTTDTISALSVPSKVSVVDASESSSGLNNIAALSSFSPMQTVGALSSTSDYSTDPTNVYVEERSAESLSTVNEILCMLGQSGYDSMVNLGAYKAQIDIGQCEGTNDSASSAGASTQNQSSGANATEYEYWTVVSSRASSTAPHIVHAWIHQAASEDEPAATIEVDLEITESVSSTNPYGRFTMNFRSHPPDSDTPTLFSGFLKTAEESGDTVLKFYCNGDMGDFSFNQKVTINRTSETSGAGSMSSQETSPQGSKTETFDIAYNDTHFYRSDGDVDNCLTRENPDTSVWRYGMYHDENYSTPGARVAINSGFPIKFGDEHGWAGYYGLWFSDSVTLNSGDTVLKQDFASNGTTETPYTVFIADGKLKKHTKKSITLEEAAGLPLNWSQCTQSGEEWTCAQYRVKWNKVDQVFYKTAVMNEDNWVWQNVTPTAVTFSDSDYDFSFNSEALGGNGRINLRNPENGQLLTLANATNVIFHVEDTVFPGDPGIPTSLACFDNCPDPSVINTGSPYFAKSTWQDNANFSTVNMDTAPAALTAGTNFISYDFDASSMLLKYDGTAAVMTESDNSQYGIWTGAMFELTNENRTALACDWDSTKTCNWQAWDKLSVFYTWETGTDSWNKLTALKSGDTFLTFDPPLSVEYTHTTGAKYYIEYNGFGDLHGIPGKCVDMDTGLNTDCMDSSDETKFIRWVPEFSIADGTAVIDAVSGSFYYIKALEKEERMRSVDTSNCSNVLTLTSYTLPDATLYVAPNIGTEPTVTGAPAIIGGVLQ